MPKFCFVFSLLLLLFCSLPMTSQNLADSSGVVVHADPALSALLDKRKAIGVKNLKGYRVKIHFGAEKAKANEIKSKFSQKYPDVPAFMEYDNPNFSISVGNFRSRLEVYRFFKKIQSEFPNAFIVETHIDFPDLNVKKDETEGM
jgi:hypothetical protein